MTRKQILKAFLLAKALILVIVVSQPIYAIHVVSTQMERVGNMTWNAYAYYEETGSTITDGHTHNQIRARIYGKKYLGTSDCSGTGEAEDNPNYGAWTSGRSSDLIFTNLVTLQPSCNAPPRSTKGRGNADHDPPVLYVPGDIHTSWSTCGSCSESIADEGGGSCPIVIDTAGLGFDLTNADNGVLFDITADGIPERLSWTSAGSDDGWLVLDRNGNGIIDDGTELFGNFTPQPTAAVKNGYLALAEYDKISNGGNGNGVIDSGDSIFSSLNVWIDIDHDGFSVSNELYSLGSLDITGIDLDYEESMRHDPNGNLFRYRAKIYSSSRGRSPYSYDVFLQKY